MSTDAVRRGGELVHEIGRRPYDEKTVGGWVGGWMQLLVPASRTGGGLVFEPAACFCHPCTRAAVRCFCISCCQPSTHGPLAPDR